MCKFKAFAIAVIMTAIYGICIATYSDNIDTKTCEISYEDTEYINTSAVVLEGIKNEIIGQISQYINSVAPNANVDGEILFNLCEQYGVDVRFAMAQAQVESHYATKGTAKKTKSMFNVGAYDGHSAKRQIRNGFGFENVNDSIEPYLRLITSEYLIDNKTTNDLLHNYVNYLGMRYATNPRYEKMLQSVYNRINNTTDLDVLIVEYNEYKEIIG
jgi:flagellum-specific peptidoglycan hydrolase FlgJ